MKNIISYILHYGNIILKTCKIILIRKFNLEAVSKPSVFTQPRETQDGRYKTGAFRLGRRLAFTHYFPANIDVDAKLI